MSFKTYSFKIILLHSLYIAFLSFFVVITIISAIYGFINMTNYYDAMAACFVLLLSILIFLVDFFECRSLSARIYVNDLGIGIKHFLKIKVFIKWDEIKEIGIGKITTPFGFKSRIYFSSKVLSDEEKSDLVTMKYHTVHLSYIKDELLDIIYKNIPTPLIETMKEIHKNYKEKNFD